MNEEMTVTAERNGVRKQMGVVQWQHLTSNGKFQEYDGWHRVNPDSPIEEIIPPPFEIRKFEEDKNTPVPEGEKDALQKMNEAINGGSSKPKDESFGLKKKNEK